MVAFLTSDPKRRGKAEERKLRRQMSEAGEISATLRLLAPWIILLASIGLAPLAYLGAQAADAQGFTAFCAAACGTVLVGSSLHLNRGREIFATCHEAFNFGAPFAVFAYTVLYGPNALLEIGTFFAGLASAIIWHKRHGNHTLRDLERRGAASPAAMSAAWRVFAAEHMPTIRDSEMVVLANTKDEFRGGIDLGPGEVPGDIDERVIDKITRWAGGIAGGTTLFVGEQLDRVGVQVLRRDPLKQPFPWLGPSGPGESIIETIDGLGRYRDFVPLTMLLPHVAGKGDLAEDKQQSHMAFTGMSRSGKGDAGELLDVNVACRRDSGVILLDPVKGAQQLGVIGDAAIWSLSTMSAVRAFLWCLVHRTIPMRAQHLGEPWRNPLGKNLREWVPGCGLTWLMVHMYEASALYGNENMVKITEQAASVGIMLLTEAQRFVHDRVDTTQRANTADIVHFGCKDPDDARFTLPPELIDMGAKPWVWRNKQPGMCLTALTHLPLNRQVIPARWARRARDGSDVAAALDEHRPFVEIDLDPVTAASFGDPYAKFAAARQARRDARPRQHAFTGQPGPRYADPLGQPPVTRGAVLVGQPPAPAPAPAEPAPGLVVPPAAQRRSTPAAPAEPAPAPRQVPGTGFDLDPGDDPEFDGTEPGAEEDRAELTEVAERVIGDMAAEMDGDPDAVHVLHQAVDALERMGDPRDDEPQTGPPVERFDDIDFPDPDEDLEEVSRDEAMDVLLDVLAIDIGVGNQFRPSDVYAAIRGRAKRSDSWVRKEMATLTAWGCIRDTEVYGVYEVIHTQRQDRPGPADGGGGSWPVQDL
ncbi:hypothetical protein F5972_08710 [Microbispora cellulosiformans]|uniref:Uncharacterized protein n=1 Tax=Microbispora cellulosiformans TaxID=2614688 RepID=A0A5J5K541_9ACTN|nr:hypothetical protein [Microbispora cellulosiformans]KAA9379721.1 hypothetical protein F5972_08710 [Microbispora cellulosiformans]